MQNNLLDQIPVLISFPLFFNKIYFVYVFTGFLNKSYFLPISLGSVGNPKKWLKDASDVTLHCLA